jgi:nitroreductase
MCLGVDGGSVSNGALIQQFNCAAPSPGNNQSWRFVRTSGDYYQIVNGKSEKCIGVSGGSTANGAILAQFSCSVLGSVNNQSWLFTR